MLRSKRGGAKECPDVSFLCDSELRHWVRDHGAVAGGDHGLEGVSQGPDQVRGERVSKHVGHQDLGG